MAAHAKAKSLLDSSEIRGNFFFIKDGFECSEQFGRRCKMCIFRKLIFFSGVT